MSTQLEEARAGRITPAMVECAESENVTAEKVLEEIVSGKAVLPHNPAHVNCKPAIVGRAFRTKVNANLGRSSEASGLEEESAKLDVALDSGADFVMDLSVGADLGSVRSSLIAASPVGLGTVPLYEALSRSAEANTQLDVDILMRVIREQAEQGVDFMTLHSGLLREHVALALERLMGIVSRGGAIMAEWMVTNNSENPLYERWDEVLEICRQYDVTVSLGDGLRPGCLADASDKAQFAELEVLGQLVQRTRKAGVQVMVEGPGHVPFGEIQMNMERQQELCDGAPFYVLGPIVTDIAPGYDHITSSIGATSAAYYGASLLCYVTPSEHLGLPAEADVRAGVMAHRIAAHAADVARGLHGARHRDDEMAKARVEFDWQAQFKLALDGAHAKEIYDRSCSDSQRNEDHCSMCGKDFCALRTTKRINEARMQNTY